MASEIEGASLGSLSPENPHPGGVQGQTVAVASAVAQNHLMSEPQAKYLRYTQQELLSLQPCAGDEAAAMASTPVDEVPKTDAKTEVNPVVEDLPLKRPEQDASDNLVAEPTSGWGGVLDDEENPNQPDAMMEAEAPGNDGQNNPAPGAVEEKQPKKKKKKKSSGKNKKSAPTGFEEFYADPPITPQEHDEELNEIYHHSRSFVERIQQCVQRYRARRKLDSARAHYFNKYLALGGFDTGMKAFNGGLDNDALDTYNAKEIAEFQATDHIRSGTGNPKFYDAGAPQNWVVDFEGVAKGFLSHRAPNCFGLEPNVIKEYCGVIRNFLNYVLTHSACPEYTTDILAAKMVCDVAEKELQMIRVVSRAFPGDFNMAASTIYGGRYKELCIESFPWPGEGEMEGNDFLDGKKRICGMTYGEAQRIFKTAIVFVGTYEHFTTIMAENCEAVSEIHTHFEVTGIYLPSPELRVKFGGTKDCNGDAGHIKALGILQVKHWDNPDAEPEDQTDDEDLSPQPKAEHPSPLVETFWLEEEILEKCWVGMKFGATVRALDNGIKYIDYISGIFPTFYTYLPSERLDDWKEPKPNPRPPPMVGDLDRGDEEMECEENDC